jgi:hypothetical protein
MRDRFTIVLLTVVCLTVVCGGLALAIAFTVPAPTPLLERAFNTLVEMFSVGAGAIFGLLGGNALKPT